MIQSMKMVNMMSYDSICCFRSSEASRSKRVCWEVTSDCNLSCSFCHRCIGEVKEYDIKNINQTIKLLKRESINEVIISGGEPLVYAELFPLLDKLKKEGFDLDICSNATLINKDIAKRLLQYTKSISISLDGFEKIRHDSMRGIEGSWSKAVEAIRLMIGLGMNVHITTVVDSDFICQIPSMIEFALRNGVKSIAFLGLMPVDNGLNELMNSENQKRIAQVLKSARDKYPEIEINTKQLINNEDMDCKSGCTVFGMGPDAELSGCLLLRDRDKGIDFLRDGLGCCPGSQYIVAER